MVLKRIGGALFVSAFLASFILVLGSAPAEAAKAEPTISSLGWWWEDATTEEREVPSVGTVTLETPNPFCPSAGSGTGSPQQVCAEGRLPIEVRQGDYEQQNKISAVGFDLSLIPVGSKVNKFTVTFREAKEGCYDKDGKADDDPNDDTCEQTSPLNVGTHQLQACVVTAYFGDAEARPYKEAPKYECTNADPRAKRKEVNSDKDGEGSNFYWTFDLTKYAQQWTSKFTAVTGIMLVGVPNTTGQGQNAEQDSDTWRVVLAGPKFENGVSTALDYIPAEDPLVPPVPPGTDPGSGTIPTDTGTGFDTGVGTTDTGTTDTGTTDTGTTDDAGAAATPTAPPLQAVSDQPQVQEIPGYLWLGLLAGLVGFSLVRSVVIDKTTGVRPNGVLATIHNLNAERGSSPAAAADSSPGPLAAAGAAIGVVGKKIGGAFGKLNFRKKG